jgi:2-C-methyl-D-erythritol 2,4-cyclodiphosphate synthase
MNIRVGFGTDFHKFGEGLDFIIGGIKVEHTKGCIAHSDGDVLIHAMCDAILGAANLRDIGVLFPDNDNTYKNIDSKILLKKTVEILRQKGFEIVNIDSTICLEKPKINPHITKMKEVLAQTMNIDVDRVSIKATTTEKMGFVGREEGVSASSVVLINKISNV